MAKPAVLITGAAGEVGHTLIEHFVKEGSHQVIALDLNPNIQEQSRHGVFAITADITNKSRVAEIFSQYNIESVFHLAAVLSSGGERNPERTHFVNVEGSFNLLTAAKQKSQQSGASVKFLFPSTIAVYGLPSVEEKNRAGKVSEEQYAQPITMYGINKLYIENLGRYFSRYYKFLESDPNDVKIDFRALRFPGLMSSETMPSGGTSDYASEMIHYCAQNKPYACFVSPNAKLPFMSMADGVRALIELWAAPRDKLTKPAYNVGSFAVTAEEIHGELMAHFPNAQISYNPHRQREGIVNTWPADVDDSAAERDWGWKSRLDFKATFRDYLIPGITRKYR